MRRQFADGEEMFWALDSQGGCAAYPIAEGLEACEPARGKKSMTTSTNERDKKSKTLNDKYSLVFTGSVDVLGDMVDECFVLEAITGTALRAIVAEWMKVKSN